MSDDFWREGNEEGESLFGDYEPTRRVEEVGGGGDEHDDVADEDGAGLSFGESDTGSLPHWTEPPTGELPKIEAQGEGEDPPLDDDLDVWSSFTSESPVWRDSEEAEQHPTAETNRIASPATPPDNTGEHPMPAREPSRITIGTDPSGMPRRPPPGNGRRPRGQGQRQRQRPSTPSRSTPVPSSGRDMPVAIAVGLVLAAVFIAALLWREVAVCALVVVILGLASVEFYDKVSEKGYRPAVVPGIVTCLAAPLATYWVGVEAIPLVLAFGFIATAGSFIGARSVDAGPMPNVSITTLGVAWIGLLGAFAMLILRFSTEAATELGSELYQHAGTDTLFLLALGVVANDVGAFFVGSAAGRTPLRQWISPNKTVEGLIGGSLMTIVVLLVVGIGGWSDTWSKNSHLLALAVVISVMAPIGDMVESMFKRNLDVKDFGTLVKGHGGVLDRFDGFLFVLPAVYYLTLVLEPWVAQAG